MRTAALSFDSSRIVFFGSPRFAVTSLDALVRSGRGVSLVITQPDQEAGRGRNVMAPAVKEYALARGLPVRQPVKMKEAGLREELRATGAGLFVAASYGRMLPDELLAIPALTLNVHASLLPRWRGASPIHRAIVAGDPVTGISIMRIVKEMDAGDVLHQVSTPIGGEETAGELEDRLAELGAAALVEALDRLDRCEGRFTPQDPGRVTFAPLLTKEEGLVRWNRDARGIHDRIRGLNPWPGAFTPEGGKTIKLHRSRLTGEKAGGAGPGTIRSDKRRLWVACRDEWLEILELQREGRTPQPAAAFLAGYRGVLPETWGGS